MHRITLGNAVFEGENNVYLLTDGETTLIDTGFATAGTRNQLKRGLEAHDTDSEDIDTIFLTHYHADHSGLAAEIQQASGATVYAHAADAPLIEGDEEAWVELQDRRLRYFEEWGMPREKRNALVACINDRPDPDGDRTIVNPFTDGDQIDIGETELEVLHTPGHTLGLSSFVPADRNEVFTGDALLPVYTPNIGGADVRVERPLEQYLESLQRIIDRNFDRAWPGHRDPIDDPSERAQFIIEHHEERAYRVISTLHDVGQADAWTVSAELFGELENIHILHGPGEAYAHLEHLARVGDIQRVGSEYRLTDATRKRFEARSDEAWPL